MVRDSYFEEAYWFNRDEHGYGVDAGHRTTDCLVDNNPLHRLTHTMLLQIGATGNVFGYNYSTQPNAGGNWTPCGNSLHGHFPHLNLFEGNIAQKIDVSDHWGPAGPSNTFFHNRVESEGTDVLDHSHEQNIIGNVLLSDEGEVNIHDLVERTYLYGNVDGNDRYGEHAVPASYYPTRKPHFFNVAAWPLTTQTKNPAQLRYESH